MDSWEGLVVQWVNCLYGDVNDCVKTLKDLQDGKIYYKLISEIKSWNYRETNSNEKSVVFDFLKDEYPNFVLGNKNGTIENLSVAILILSRLSLEPIFHKSLCAKLRLDLQIKIKTILECIYPLGKSLTADDLCKSISLSEDGFSKPFSAKPRRILEEFLNSPVIRSVHSDNKIHGQNREIRHLRADIETLRYEKSELIEDLKNQEKKIGALEHKLQETLSQLKSLQIENTKTAHINSVNEREDTKIIELYKTEIQSLETYVAGLQDDNCQLQDEKNDLMNDIKMYKEKYRLVEEKYKNNEQIVESMLLQMEKKDEELTELKIKYDELCNFLKEKSRMSFSNQSFETDDRVASETFFNVSEPLSTVIEIQLQDSKKEIAKMQSEFNSVNGLLTVMIEEYGKLKRKYNHLLINSMRQVSVEKKECIVIEKQEQRLVQNQCIVNNRIKSQINDILGNEYKKSLLLWLLNNYDKQKIHEISTSSANTNITETLQKCPNEKSMVVIHKNWEAPKVTFKSVFQDFVSGLNNVLGKDDQMNNLLRTIQTHSSYTSNTEKCLELVNFAKKNIELEIKALNTEKYKLFNNEDNDSCNRTVCSVTSQKEMVATCVIFNVIKNCIIKFIKDAKSDKLGETSLLSRSDLKSLHSIWNSLYESIQYNFKIYKAILLLEKNWFFVLELINDICNDDLHTQPELKELFQKKNIIENQIKDARFKNFQYLSLNLATAVQLVTLLSKLCNETTTSYESDCIMDSNTVRTSISDFNLEESSKQNSQHKGDMSAKIVSIKRRIDNFYYLTNLYKENCRSKQAAKDVPAVKEERAEPPRQAVESSEQFQQYLKEVHEKYELKLEKMKEKMKAAYSSQMQLIKKEQERLTSDRIEALQAKLESQCYSHTEELKKYKKHISELTTQLWDVGEKLIIEKQRKEDCAHRLKDMQGARARPEPPEPEERAEARRPSELQSVRGFQIMGNAFSTEDEEGEVFDTTYLTDVPRSRNTLSALDVNRLSILQMRNAKCKPHLKSSYPAELQFHPAPYSEEEVKTGSPAEELFNDSLSQSLLTGKKVKRGNRTRQAADSPRRSRRFSNIFRKNRLSTERK